MRRIGYRLQTTDYRLQSTVHSPQSLLCVLCEKLLSHLSTLPSVIRNSSFVIRNFFSAFRLLLCAFAPLCLFSSCCSIPPVPPGPNPVVRFLITFDDGPSGWKGHNPTLSILDSLATNDVQPGIVAIFFLQTHHPHGADTPIGQETMLEVPRHGQITGIHSVSPQGHIDHTKMSTNDLVARLIEAKQILKKISGTEPVFVRPPYGVSNPVTRAIYRELNLNILMADVPAHDGVIYGVNSSPTRRSHIRKLLASVRQKLVEHPDGPKPYPVIVAFHDVNPYTARHMTEYLRILREEAARVGLDLPEKPFYGTRDESTAAAMSRILPADKPGSPR